MREMRQCLSSSLNLFSTFTSLMGWLYLNSAILPQTRKMIYFFLSINLLNSMKVFLQYSQLALSSHHFYLRSCFQHTSTDWCSHFNVNQSLVVSIDWLQDRLKNEENRQILLHCKCISVPICTFIRTCYLPSKSLWFLHLSPIVQIH